MNEKSILSLNKKLEEKIRHNGILIERLDDDIRKLADEVLDFNVKLSDARSNIAEIKENTSDLHIIRKLVKQHQRQLAKMR